MGNFMMFSVSSFMLFIKKVDFDTRVLMFLDTAPVSSIITFTIARSGDVGLPSILLHLQLLFALYMCVRRFICTH